MRWRPVAFGLLTAVTLVILGGSSASAHATLERTFPQQASMLSSSPGTVRLVFSESVGIGPRSLEVLDASGHRVDRGAPHHLSGTSDVAVELRGGLPKGSYAVVWHVVSADSHPVSGTFTFGIGVAAGAAPPVSGSGRTVELLHGVGRWLSLTGAVLLIGTTVFVLALWPRGRSHRRTRRLAAAGLSACAVGTGGLLLLQGPYGAGLGLGAVTDLGLAGDTLATRYGKLLLLRLVLLGAGAVALRRGGSIAGSRRLALGALGVLLILTFSLSEHSGQGSLAALAGPADAAHLSAVCVWLGGLAVLVVGFLPTATESERGAVLPRWSRLAMVSVAVLVGTGAFLAWRELGGVAPIPATTYGRLLVAKTGALLLLLGIAELSRRAVARGRSLPSEAGGTSSRLRRSVAAEASIGVLVLGLSAALINSVPARDAYAPAFAATLTAHDAEGDPATLLVDVERTRAGLTTLHLYTYTTSGAILPFATAHGSMVERSKRLGPVRFDFANSGPGHGTAAGVVVPSPGRWSLTVQVQTDVFKDYAADTAYTVR